MTRSSVIAETWSLTLTGIVALCSFWAWFIIVNLIAYNSPRADIWASTAVFGVFVITAGASGIVSLGKRPRRFVAWILRLISFGCLLFFMTYAGGVLQIIVLFFVGPIQVIWIIAGIAEMPFFQKMSEKWQQGMTISLCAFASLPILFLLVRVVS